MSTAHEHLIGEWVLFHGLARLHHRAKILEIIPGMTCTWVKVHPVYCIYNWNKDRTQITYESKVRSSEDKPAVLMLESYSEVALQPKDWPEK